MSDDTFKGQAVQATWQIEDGKHAGRHVWDRIIVQHDESPEAMKFGRRKLKDIAVACGVSEQITDLSVLLNSRARSLSRSRRTSPANTHQRTASPASSRWSRRKRQTARPTQTSTTKSHRSDGPHFSSR